VYWCTIGYISATSGLFVIGIVVNWLFSCSDYVSIHDGTDATTLLLLQFCDDNYNNKTVTSTGDRMYIQFVSDDQLEAQGFVASFRFIPRDRLTTSVATTPSSSTSGAIR